MLFFATIFVITSAYRPFAAWPKALTNPSPAPWPPYYATQKHYDGKSVFKVRGFYTACFLTRNTLA